MHKTDFAPVLSATSNLDSVWIISFPNLYRACGRKTQPLVLDQSWARHLRLEPFRGAFAWGCRLSLSAVLLAEPAIMA
jgi:hypothetical protein